VPNNPVSIAVALADKIDTLTGFWAIDEKPTGSKDPFALRRAALGVIRLVLENKLRVNLLDLFGWGLAAQKLRVADEKAVARDLLAFFIDRLKVYLRDAGARHDLIDAAIGAGTPDDLLMILRRVEALGSFLEMEDGQNLLAGYKRAVNIIRAEEKKEKDAGKSFNEKHAADLRAQDEEHALATAIEAAAKEASAHVAREDFAGAMSALAKLRAPVDAFFVAVTVNDTDAAKRLNRLRLLNELRAAMHGVADFSKVAG